MAVQGRASSRLLALGGEIASAAVSPSETQVNEIEQLQNRLRLGSRWSALLMVAAVVGMTM